MKNGNGYSERELELKLKEQHKKTRHNAIDLVQTLAEKYENKISDSSVQVVNDLLNEIISGIHNLKQF